MSEFLSVIEWFDDSGIEIFHRIPQKGSAETKIGSQLIVMENQEAAFFKDGIIYDILGPGRHTLTTYNIPLLTKALSLPFKFKSPFRVVVYFVNKKTFFDLKWGTKNPIPFSDKVFEMVRLRAFGGYAIKINDTRLAFNTLVGSQNLLSVNQIRDFLGHMIVMRLNQLLGTMLESILALSVIYDEIAKGVSKLLKDDLKKFGLELVHFTINSITPPDDVERKIDEKSGIKAIGDLNNYVKYSLAEALKKIPEGTQASDASSAVSIGFGAGAGIAIAQTIGNVFKQEPQIPNATDIESRLLRLKEMFEKGLITQDEYNNKKESLKEL